MNQAFKVILAIPARLESSRLPRKLVAEIGGKPMIGHVLERCLQATAAHATVLCTDSQELADQAAELEASSLLTSSDCSSGSDRIASVADQLLAAVIQRTRAHLYHQCPGRSTLPRPRLDRCDRRCLHRSPADPRGADAHLSAQF